MKRITLCALTMSFIFIFSSLTAQIQTGVFRTPAGNTDYHQFTRNSNDPVVFINQESATGSILRLSSGTATANQNVKFSFENNGNFGLGTSVPTEKLTLFS